jgi:hypothetical protein
MKMTLVLNEINGYEIKPANESADTRPFLVEIFNEFVFSIKKFAIFEHKAKKLVNHNKTF